MNPCVSIVIRSKNEERWIKPCLSAIFDQSFKDFEVILVDNKSTDKTVEKAQQFGVKIIKIDQYFPGRALNLGIEASKGKYIAILSAHCIPRDSHWLENFVKNLEEDKNKEIAGAYGRQEPLSFTRDLDKRDLMIAFGLDRKVQIKDSFFHNANSMIRRDVWEKISFDNNATNIEDRIWAESILKEGYKIIYDPEASVYHHHGIHQSGDEQRCFNVVRILESLDGTKVKPLNINSLHITAIIPIKGSFLHVGEKPLLDYTLQRALESKYVRDVVVSTDNEEVADYAIKSGARVPFLRPKDVFDRFAGLDKVLQFTVQELEKKAKLYSDVIVVLKETYPFRPPRMLDDMIEEMVRTGVDTLMPTHTEFRSCFKKDDDKIHEIDEGFLPREVKEPIYISLAGLGLITLPKFIREGRQVGDNVGIFEITDKHCKIEVRDKNDIEIAEPILKTWHEQWNQKTLS